MSAQTSKKTGKLSIAQLAGVTYLMVSGGPYGVEELVKDSGYRLALLILLLVPVIWSLPVGLMVGELSTAIPTDGGFYVWVRRAMGPFWGFQEAWLSLTASIFDMAAYPALFVLSLSRLWAPAGNPYIGFLIGATVVALCVLWNLLGASAVGDGSLWMGVILLLPFVFIAALALTHPTISAAHRAPPAHPDLLAGIVVAMWNYMGWDNASTIAGEVDAPQKTYPRAVAIALVAAVLFYVLPILAVAKTGLASSSWDTGSWVSIAALLGGPLLGTVVVITTMVSTFGMFNSLTLSLSRLPVAMAEDGYAPSFLTRRLRNGAPWVSILVCGIAWTAALGLAFDRLLILDILLYGVSLILEFVALVVLRFREPNLVRPFRVPCGILGALLAGVGPAVLLVLAGIESGGEKIGGVSALAVGFAIMAAGPPLYLMAKRRGVTAGT